MTFSDRFRDWWDEAKPHPGPMTVMCWVVGTFDVSMVATVILKATRIWL